MKPKPEIGTRVKCRQIYVGTPGDYMHGVVEAHNPTNLLALTEDQSITVRWMHFEWATNQKPDAKPSTHPISCWESGEIELDEIPAAEATTSV